MASYIRKGPDGVDPDSSGIVNWVLSVHGSVRPHYATRFALGSTGMVPKMWSQRGELTPNAPWSPT